jgi:hypothetical protein
MDLQDLKRWHWALIGLLAGALWAGSRLFYGVELPNDDTAGSLQQDFCWFLAATEKVPAMVRDEASYVYLSDLQVHPVMPDTTPEGRAAAARAGGKPSRVQWVTGNRQRRRFRQLKDPSTAEPFRYKATLPFTPEAVYDLVQNDWSNVMPGGPKPLKGYTKPGSRSYATILDYFKEINRKYGGGTVAYRYCWWEETRFTAAIYPLAGIVLIGGFWPTLLNFLVGIGLGRKKKAAAADEYDVGHFKGTSKAIGLARAKAGMTERDEQQLAAMTAELEKDLAASATLHAPSGGDGAAAAAAPAARELTGGPIKPQPQSTTTDAPAKTYGADTTDYYPTEIHKAAKGDDSSKS